MLLGALCTGESAARPCAAPYRRLRPRFAQGADDGRGRLSFRTSFDSPLTLGARPHESIEVRTLVFLPPAEAHAVGADTGLPL
jgi:hypothetical protein